MVDSKLRVQYRDAATSKRERKREGGMLLRWLIQNCMMWDAASSKGERKGEGCDWDGRFKTLCMI